MKRTVFVHVPRTAGLSVTEHTRTMLHRRWQGFYRGGWRSWNDEKMILSNFDGNVPFTWTGHARPMVMIAAGWFDREWWESSYRFAFVRNTWDRLVSLYEALRKSRLKRNAKSSRWVAVVRTNRFLKDFGTFVREVTDPSTPWMPNVLLRCTRSKFSQALPQTYWLQDGIDFVGRFERLEEDWKKVCDEVGMMQKGSLPKTNQTDRGPYQDYYTNETRELVRRRYREEIERFSFTF